MSPPRDRSRGRKFYGEATSRGTAKFPVPNSENDRFPRSDPKISSCDLDNKGAEDPSVVTVAATSPLPAQDQNALTSGNINPPPARGTAVVRVAPPPPQVRASAASELAGFLVLIDVYVRDAGGALALPAAEWAARLGVETSNTVSPLGGSAALAFSRWLLPSIPQIVWDSMGLSWRRTASNGRRLVEITSALDDDADDDAETPTAPPDRPLGWQRSTPPAWHGSAP